MSKILKIGDKYYDFGTKNTSFLLTASELKALGIKNYYFMLEVKYPQTGVQDLDPYNPNLSAEDISKILLECKWNPWYFFREVSRADAVGIGPVPLYLHRAGLAAIWCFVNSIDFHLVQPRQTYKTTVITAIMTYMVLFEYQNAKLPYLHVKAERCADNIKLLRSYISALPPYMNPWSKMKKLPGAESLKYEEHKVEIACVAAPASPNKADSAMRGFSLYAWFIDEFEFVPHIMSIINAANPTIIQARLTAKQYGIRSCMMTASTPGNLDTEEGQQTKAMIDKLPRFIETFYDMTKEERDSLYTTTAFSDTPEPVPIEQVYIEFNYLQLRKDEQYLRAQFIEADKNNNLDEYRRGVLLQRFRGGETVLFYQEDIDYIKSFVRKPDYEIFIMKKYSLFVYKHEIVNVDMNSSTPYFDTQLPYIIGVDVATGSGNDNSAIVIINPYTLDVVAEFKSPYIGVVELMKVITTIASIVPHGIFCLESNTIGKSIVDMVMHTKMEHRFYYDPQLDISKNAIRKDTDTISSLKAESKERGYIGTNVSPSVRATMFQLLQRYVHDFREHIYSQYLVDDICSLVRKKNGRIEAGPGAHDDIVMAYNHCIYVLTYGYNLNRYGIDKTRCTFEKSYEVLKDYEKQEDEKIVDNMIPYEQPTEYEEQFRDELINMVENRSTQTTMVDEMGYHYNEYSPYGVNNNQTYQQQQQQQYDNYSANELAEFYSMQGFPM
jgi:hypothetical protein